jgi:hypothetical protein
MKATGERRGEMLPLASRVVRFLLFSYRSYPNSKKKLLSPWATGRRLSSRWASLSRGPRSPRMTGRYWSERLGSPPTSTDGC